MQIVVSSGTLRILVKRFDGVDELFPGNDDSHLLQELFLACLLTKLFKVIRSGIVVSCLKNSTVVNAMPYYRADHE